MLSEAQMVNIHNASLSKLFVMELGYDAELAAAANDELANRFMELKTEQGL